MFRYVRQDSGSTGMRITVPLSKCGTQTVESSTDRLMIENTLVIQVIFSVVSLSIISYLATPLCLIYYMSSWLLDKFCLSFLTFFILGITHFRCI